MLIAILTLQIYLTKNILKQLFKNMQGFQILYSINSQRMSISLNFLEYGGIRNIVTNWTSIDSPKQLRIGENLKKP